MNRQSILRQVNSSREMQGELRKILNENSQDISTLDELAELKGVGQQTAAEILFSLWCLLEDEKHESLSGST